MKVDEIPENPEPPECISDEQFMDKYQCETCACDEPCQIEYNRLRSIPEQKGVEQGEERFFHVIFVSGEGSVFPSQKLFINQQSAVDYSRDFAARCIVDNDLPQLDSNSRLSVLEYMVVD